MFSSFRVSMAWLHTWFGLVLGYVLMVAFFFGTLSVFDREIDRWALPQTRFEPQPMPSYDRMLAPLFAQLTADADEYAREGPKLADPAKGALPPVAQLQADEYWAYTTHRDPVLRMGGGFLVPHPRDPQGHNHVHGEITIDPRSGQALPATQLKIGSEFFYPMHYGLHLHWQDLGIWIVGLAALVMLAALVSGVVMHRKLFRELFTFRPRKAGQRSVLDLHNLTGVVALPFHFVFALSGLTIFASLYLPVGETVLRGPAMAGQQVRAQAMGLPFERSGRPAALASVDAMVAEAQRRWAARGMPGQVGYLEVRHVGDAQATVSIYRAGSDRVALVGQAVHFEGASGRVLHEEPPPSAVASINEFLTGLHLQHFEHWLLRWLYVLSGLAGCTCIATGFVFFVNKRRLQHARLGLSGARWADALAVGCVTGMVIAALAILVANRLLPAGLPQRGDWEEGLFWAAWASSFAHAAWRSGAVQQGRPSPAWREQCLAIAVLAVAAPLLNWATTGDHLLKTLALPYWPVAGLDLALLATAAAAATAARRLRRGASRAAAGDDVVAVDEEPAHA